MALVTPIAQPRVAFDARNGAQFNFTIDDSGDRIVASYIEIFRQSDNSRVYWKKQETTQRYFNILPTDPNYNLTNGTYYSFRVKTYNAQGQESLWSNSVPFYCYSTPIVEITNLPAQELPVLETSNFEFKFAYTQAEGELLDHIRLDISIERRTETGDVWYEGVFTSGNILANEDNQYSATVFGLINDAIYIVDIDGTTVNGTDFCLRDQLGYFQRFTVKSVAPEYYSQINVEPRCDKGYIEVGANLVVTDGEARYTPQYVGDDSNKQILLLPRHNWVKWTQGFSIQQAFTLGIWGKIGQEGEILCLSNDRNSGCIKMYYRRGYISGIQDAKDFIEINFVDDEGHTMIKGITQPLDILKPDENYMIFFQYKDISHVTFKFLKKSDTTFEWRWNLPAQVYYGQMLNTKWVGEDYKTYDYSSQDIERPIVTEYYNPIKLQELIPLNRCKLSNGIYDQIDITSDVDVTIETYEPIWDTKTILDANFNGNISGGNTDIILSEVGALKIKRRQAQSNTWITLKEIEVSKPEDFKVDYIDTCVPSGVEQIYAIVPVDPNGQETSTYITKSTGVFRWNGVFVSMGTDIMRFFSRVQYNSLTKNREIGTFNPLASKYPVVVQNGLTSYLSGTLSTLVLGEDWDGTKPINRLSVVSQLTRIHEWLDKGEPIVLKDWNGWILICRPTSGDTVSFDSNYGNGVATASFNFVEQGKYDSQEDLYEAGIIDYKEQR
jgi:hypothetical protein